MDPLIPALSGCCRFCSRDSGNFRRGARRVFQNQGFFLAVRLSVAVTSFKGPYLLEVGQKIAAAARVFEELEEHRKALKASLALAVEGCSLMAGGEALDQAGKDLQWFVFSFIFPFRRKRAKFVDCGCWSFQGRPQRNGFSLGVFVFSSRLQAPSRRCSSCAELQTRKAVSTCAVRASA